MVLTCAGGDCKGLFSSSNTCKCTIFLKQIGITSTLLQEKSNFTKGSCTSSKSNKKERRCYICIYFCHKIIKFFWINLLLHSGKNTNSGRDTINIYSIIYWEIKSVIVIQVTINFKINTLKVGFFPETQLTIPILHSQVSTCAA